MAEIINLRLARKRSKRILKEEEAGRNRVIHGMSKADLTLSRKQRELEQRDMDGKKLSESQRPSMPRTDNCE